MDSGGFYGSWWNLRLLMDSRIHQEPFFLLNMTERVNRKLKPLIAIYAQQRPNSWDNKIQKLAFAIRTAVNDKTGETPAFMMFGRDSRGPLDLLIGETTEEVQPTTSEHRQIQEYKKEFNQ
ncbi:unnamed protein product [Rotaria magnacalcarata]|uniref:Uncharacterized protein n=2 Tax=Rotaria magnacalcarata TaxID=392030 RepID=A0A817AE82_9BILA|nr:unnamed protein product [Rotaria magnacalcarata]CAF2261535.1 unnamed protein product [Rotaria magnacalcarata]